MDCICETNLSYEIEGDNYHYENERNPLNFTKIYHVGQALEVIRKDISLDGDEYFIGLDLRNIIRDNDIKKLGKCCLCGECERYRDNKSKMLKGQTDSYFLGMDIKQNGDENEFIYKSYCSLCYIKQLQDKDSYLNYLIKKFSNKFSEKHLIKNYNNYYTCDKWRYEREKQLNKKSIQYQDQYNHLDIDLCYKYFSDYELYEYFNKYNNYIDSDTNRYLNKCKRKQNYRHYKTFKDDENPTTIEISLDLYKMKVRKIEDFFLSCKYNPKYKYCRNFINGLYDENFN